MFAIRKFVPGTPLHPSLMFVGKALPNIIRLGWKGLPGTNILTYHEHPSIKEVKGFITLVPGANVIKPFMALIYECL
jgi:hypothetical protein